MVDNNTDEAAGKYNLFTKKKGNSNAPFCMMYRCIEFQLIELSQTEQALQLICWRWWCKTSPRGKNMHDQKHK
jgi:hypothetical protein